MGGTDSTVQSCAGDCESGLQDTLNQRGGAFRQIRGNHLAPLCTQVYQGRICTFRDVLSLVGGDCRVEPAGPRHRVSGRQLLWRSRSCKAGVHPAHQTGPRESPRSRRGCAPERHAVRVGRLPTRSKRTAWTEIAPGAESGLIRSEAPSRGDPVRET